MSTSYGMQIVRKDLDSAAPEAWTDPTNRTVWPALHLAAFAGDTAEVARLLAGGAAVNQRSVHESACTGATALHCAAVAGAADAVACLVRAGADVSARDEAGYTALHVAAERGDAAIVKILVRAGADVRLEIGDTSALGLARRGRHVAAAGLLRQLGAR